MNVDMSLISDRDGVTESGKRVPAGTKVEYLGHVFARSVKVKLENGSEEIMNPQINWAPGQTKSCVKWQEIVLDAGFNLTVSACTLVTVGGADYLFCDSALEDGGPEHADGNSVSGGEAGRFMLSRSHGTVAVREGWVPQLIPSRDPDWVKPERDGEFNLVPGTGCIVPGSGGKKR